MKGKFLLSAYEISNEPNIYADKSSLVLEWLLRVGLGREEFSIREVARDLELSVGLVQKVFGVLVMHGHLQAVGLRTAKKFTLKKPEPILMNWLEEYSIAKKCKMRPYRTGFQDREQMLRVLKTSKLKDKVVLALHSAAEALSCKNTNLETLELYLLESGSRKAIETLLQLEPQERGYEVLLVEPYYKNLLQSALRVKQLKVTPVLLTFLDLYHFPLRGREQAEYMAERTDVLKRIFTRR